MNCIKKGSFYFIDRNEFNKAMDRVNIRVYVDYILTLCNKFRYKGYIVGGFVRDFLIGYISAPIFSFKGDFNELKLDVML